MVKLNSFTFISLNGYYKGANEDISWHQHGGEEAEYSIKSLKSNNILLFGRITFEMMRSFWPTEMAYKSFPEVADGMNKASKMVVSKSLKSAGWENTTIIHDHLIDKVTELKRSQESDITLLGSGMVLKQLSDAHLIDEYQIMIDPIFLAAGQPILNNLTHHINLELTKSRVFKSGRMLLYYQPET